MKDDMTLGKIYNITLGLVTYVGTNCPLVVFC